MKRLTNWTGPLPFVEPLYDVLNFALRMQVSSEVSSFVDSDATVRTYGHYIQTVR